MSRSPRSRRAAFTPSGSGRPVSPCHHSPRSSTLCRPDARVGELALVDDQARPRRGRRRPRRGSGRTAARGRARSLAEREPEREVGGREPARDDDLDARGAPSRSSGSRGDDDRAVADAHRGAVRQQHVAVGDARVGAHRDRRHLEPALDRPLVQRLDVRDDLLELEPARVDASRLDRPEHERVVGVCAVSDANPHDAPRYQPRLHSPG